MQVTNVKSLANVVDDAFWGSTSNLSVLLNILGDGSYNIKSTIIFDLLVPLPSPYW